MPLASLFAVIAYFRKEIKELVGRTVRAIADGDYQSQSFKIAVGLVLRLIGIFLLVNVATHFLPN